ncbi:MAG: HEAT repeat domain-containing protein [Desulfomonilaceae bacterium]
MIDWKQYLESICQEPEYTEWEKVFVRLDAEASAAGTTLDLMVQAFRKTEEQPQEKHSPSRQDALPEEFEKYDALEGLRKFASEHVLLRGRPGSGKTTTLRKLLLEEADKAMNDLRARIPVIVSLRRLKTTTSGLVRDALQRHGVRLRANQLDSLLGQGRFLLLFDGVNELPKEETRLDLESFRLKHSASTPMVFTTRDIGLGGDLGIRKKLEMAPLSPTQIESFVSAYVGDAEAAKKMLTSFRDRTRDLAQTPLLLRMLCSVFKAKTSIPSGLGEVFRIFTGRYEQEEKKDAPVSKESRRWWPRLLAKLAYHMIYSGDHPSEMALVIHRDEVEKVLTGYLKEQGIGKPIQKATQFLDDLVKHHLLKEDAQGGMEFLHQMIQEYYAAEYLLTFLSSLPSAKIQRYYLNYLKWTEPLAMMLELLDNEHHSIEFVQLALNVDPVLGAQMAGRVKREFQEKAVQLVARWQENSVLKIWLLLITQSQGAVQHLIEALEDEDANIRALATNALGNIESEATIQRLIRMCWDKDADVRRVAAHALGKIGTDEAIQTLMKALEDEDAGVRCAAAFGLGWTDSEAAIQPLIDALEDKDEDVRIAASRALGRMGADEAIEPLIKAFAGKDEDLRYAAAFALGKIGTDAAIRPLIKALVHEDADVRRAAAFGLGWPDSDAAIQPLIDALEDEDEDVRSAAARTLGRIGAEEAISSLLKTLADKDEDVRRAAAEALGRIGATAATQPLIKRLTDKDEDVRRAAAEALGRIGAEKALRPLVEALEDKDEDVRSAAARALARIGSEEAIGRILTEIENGILPTSVLHGPEREFAFGPKELPDLSKLAREKDPQLLPVIFDIQQRCRFYNPSLLPIDRRFCIVHLSDLHFREVDRAEDLYVQLVLEFKKDLELSSFQALVISGDVVNRSNEQGYNQAQKFLTDMIKEFSLTSANILIVPGNHDFSHCLSRKAYTPTYREQVMGPIHEQRHIGKDEDEFIGVKDEAKYKKRFAHFQDFYNALNKEHYPEEYFEQVIWREYAEQKIVIVGLNSAWNLDHHYRSRSELHSGALNQAVRQAGEYRYSDWLKIAVWHHPVRLDDTEKTKFNESWIQDDGFMSRLAAAGFSVILHGHAHQTEAWRFSVTTGRKEFAIHVIGAGTLDAEEGELTRENFWQYNIINVSGTKVSVECRKRVNPRGISGLDSDWLKGKSHNSTYEFDILDASV